MNDLKPVKSYLARFKCDSPDKESPCYLVFISESEIPPPQYVATIVAMNSASPVPAHGRSRSFWHMFSVINAERLREDVDIALCALNPQKTIIFLDEHWVY